MKPLKWKKVRVVTVEQKIQQLYDAILLQEYAGNVYRHLPSVNTAEMAAGSAPSLPDPALASGGKQ